MSAIDRFVQHREDLDKLGDWLARQSYWTLKKVADHLDASRKTVKKIPRPLLPWVDLTDTGSRQTRRYRPTDVLAYPAVKRRYDKAKEAGEGGDFIARRREQLATRDDRLLSLAMDRSVDAAS